MTANLGQKPGEPRQPDWQQRTGEQSAADEPTGGTEPGADETPLEDVLDLLGDEYACRILSALDEGAMPAVELVERTEMSRPTVYRRLERLESVGFVDSRMRLHTDGHHKKEFYLVVDEIEFLLRDDGVDGHVSYDGAAD